jgi:hypothetical protein
LGDIRVDPTARRDPIETEYEGKEEWGRCAKF